MIEPASLFVATISALSSIIQAYKTVKDLREEDIERADEIATHPDPKNPSVLALAQTTIDEDYLEIATENIERATKRLKDALRDPSITQAAKDQEVEAANFVVCSELSRVKRLNNGSLPGHDRFHSLWASHGCS